MERTIRRGDIYYADLNPVIGVVLCVVTGGDENEKDDR